MDRLHSASLACSCFMLGVFQCPLDDWGTPAGSVCSGPEISLAVGVDLAGSWKRIDRDGENELPSSDLWTYIQIDQGNHPRILSDTDPIGFDLESRDERTLTFGCSHYADYPLVIGQENASPGIERHTIARPIEPLYGCQVTDHNRTRHEIAPDSKRAFLGTKTVASATCLFFETYHRYDKGHQGPYERIWLTRICFDYNPRLDQIELSYRENDGPVASRWYKRDIPNPDLGASTFQDSVRRNHPQDSSSR